MYTAHDSEKRRCGSCGGDSGHEVGCEGRGSGKRNRISTSLGSAAAHEPATVTAHSPKTRGSFKLSMYYIRYKYNL